MKNLDRLREWAEAGTSSDPSYCAGNDLFAADVLALMRERDLLRDAIDLIANTGMDARQCMQIACNTLSVCKSFE